MTVMAMPVPPPEALNPTARQVTALAQVTPKSPRAPVATTGDPGVPLSMGSTTGVVSLRFVSPTARHVGPLQATERRKKVPGTSWTGPAMPLMMGTTLPSLAGLPPTATQVLEPEQATPSHA